jgi:DNA-binding GntR family transcriptional regulator
MILNGKIAPGENLRESSIAASLGVSRNTIREAVRILESGGLVRRPEMHRGAVVIEPTDAELTDLYEARLLLEVSAVRATTARTLPSVRAAFDALVAASESHQVRQIVERDLDFHAAIVSQLGNRRLDAFYAQLARDLRFFWMVLSVEDREFENPDQVISEHAAIMAALESNDLADAENLISNLIEDNVDRVRTIFAERRSESA